MSVDGRVGLAYRGAVVVAAAWAIFNCLYVYLVLDGSRVYRLESALLLLVVLSPHWLRSWASGARPIAARERRDSAAVRRRPHLLERLRRVRDVDPRRTRPRRSTHATAAERRAVAVRSLMDQAEMEREVDAAMKVGPNSGTVAGGALIQLSIV